MTSRLPIRQLVRAATQRQSCALLLQSDITSATRRVATTITKRSLPERAQTLQRTHALPHSTAATAAWNLEYEAVRALPLVKPTVATPSVDALRTLFIASAIPMVGFGFMDNIVMIQAGQYIDSTLGVTLGLATMTAAAAGQVVSDVSGVVFGGSLERLFTRLNLIKDPALSAAQRQLPLCRNIAMLGAVLGVMCGCGLGACTLLFMDLDSRERIQRAAQLQEILDDMIQTAHHMKCESCTVYVSAAREVNFDLQTQVSGKTRLAFLDHGNESEEARTCAKTREVVVSGQALYAPVVQPNGEVLAVLEFQSNESFTDEIVTEVKVMSRHLAIVLKHLIE